MKNIQGLAVSRTLLAALCLSVILVGIVPAQTGLPVFTGKFTLTSQVVWSQTVLQPGDYTITIESATLPSAALVRDGRGRLIARMLCRIDSGEASPRSELLLREKGGQLHLYALALASLGKVLVYDPALAREEVMEARSSQTVPMMLAKR